MNKKLDKFKPAIDKRVLLFLAGFMWLGVGGMLLSLSISWLDEFNVRRSFIYSGIGITAALIIHHFGFLKIVDKNLDRILPMQGKKCIFAFMTWKSYIMVFIMITLGGALRHSPIPKPYLSILYTGIGLALMLSSIRYLRVLVTIFFDET